jgi:hypothetical protein
MRRLLSTFVPLLSLVLLSACAMTFDAQSLGVPVTMGTPGGVPAEGEKFSVSTSALYAFWGAVPVKQPSLKAPLEQQLMGGKGISDLKIHVRSRWYQVLFTAITVGLLVPRTVTYEGVVTP